MLGVKCIGIAFLLIRVLCVPTPPVGHAEDLGEEFVQAAEESSIFIPPEPPSQNLVNQHASTSSVTSPFQQSDSGPHWSSGAPAFGLTAQDLYPSFHSEQGRYHPYQYGMIPTVIYHPIVVHPQQHHPGTSGSASLLPVPFHSPFTPPGVALAPSNQHVHDLYSQHFPYRTVWSQQLEGSSKTTQRLSPSSNVVGSPEQPSQDLHDLDSQPTDPLISLHAAGDDPQSILPAQSSISPMPLLPEQLLRDKGMARDYRHRDRLQRGKLGRILIERFDPESLDGTREQILHMAVEDPNFFSGAEFQTVLESDPKIDNFVQTLRQPESGEGSSRTSRDIEPVFLGNDEHDDPSSVARSTFYTRKEVKQVLYSDEHGVRSLFLTFAPGSRVVSGRLGAGQLGVWEIGPSQGQAAIGLYLRGIYRPFTATEFQQIERHSQATGRSFWFFLQRTRHSGPILPYKLSIIQKIDGPSFTPELMDLPEHPEIKSLVESGELAKALTVSKILYGRHLYVYQPTPALNRLIEEWKAAAGLPKYSFTRIIPTPEQIDNLATNMVRHYRRPRAVKVIRRPNGEMYMLNFAKHLGWLEQHRSDVVIVWKLGPAVQNKRLLIAEGFFDVKESEFEKMTADKIPGLHNSVFQYNLPGLP